MPVRVIIPPQPIVTPADLGLDGSDPAVAGMIAAVTAEIDGPDGWLGRCLGGQTLELSASCWQDCISLPFPPIIEVESVSYFDQADEEIEVDDDFWVADQGALRFRYRLGWSRPALSCEREYPVRIRYRAGYDGESVEGGGTGNVPAQAKQAIILSVQHLRALNKDDLFIRTEEVEGVGRTEYTVSEQAGNIIKKASDRLLAGLRNYA